MEKIYFNKYQFENTMCTDIQEPYTYTESSSFQNGHLLVFASFVMAVFRLSGQGEE